VLICVDSTCCEECKQIRLSRVDTAGDGAGGDVEATFLINGIVLFGGELILPPNAQHVFSEKPNAVGNIRSNQEVTMRVNERDGGTVFDPDDVSETKLAPADWNRNQDTGIENNAFFDNWRVYFVVETVCCV